MAGQITSTIGRLSQDAIQEITRLKGKYKLDDLIVMLKYDPTSKACRRLKTLRVQTALGDYGHPEKDIDKWMQGNFNEMEGTLQEAAAHLSNAMYLGTALCEIVLDNRVPGRWGEWRLKGLNPLDITKVSFRGTKGKITEVIYLDGDGRKKYIPYHRVVHIVNDPEMVFNDPFGMAESESAMPYYKSKQSLTAEMLVSGKNQATGILTAFADSNDSVRLLDVNGKPQKNMDGTDKIVSSVESLAYQLANLENSNVIVTDLKNKIIPLPLPTGDSFFINNLQYLNRQIMLSFGVSALMFDEGSVGGLGNSGISQSHKSVLDSQIDGIVKQIRDKLLEKVIKPLLVYNFGSKYARNLGTFAVSASTDPNIIISKGNFLLSAITSGAIPASDISAINVLREMCGVPKIDMEEQQRMMNAQLDQQMQQQQMQQAAMQPQQPEQQADPNMGQYP
jgi:hypothetical protein